MDAAGNAPGRLLRLRAEMRVPGLAWLDLQCEPDPDGGARYRQRAVFFPSGLAGRLYWLAVLPFHGFIFRGMAERITAVGRITNPTMRIAVATRYLAEAERQEATALPHALRTLADRARETGTGLLFLAAMFFTPLYEIVPIEAASPVLVIVGVMMAAQLTEIRWTKMEIAIPAFLTIVTMPFTYSIANGIGVGFISFALMSTFAGKAKEVHWIMWLLAGLFVIFFGMDPISNAIG